jgi:hypothetical protein
VKRARWLSSARSGGPTPRGHLRKRKVVHHLLHLSGIRWVHNLMVCCYQLAPASLLQHSEPAHRDR